MLELRALSGVRTRDRPACSDLQGKLNCGWSRRPRCSLLAQGGVHPLFERAHQVIESGPLCGRKHQVGRHSGCQPRTWGQICCTTAVPTAFSHGQRDVTSMYSFGMPGLPANCQKRRSSWSGAHRFRNQGYNRYTCGQGSQAIVTTGRGLRPEVPGHSDLRTALHSTFCARMKYWA
jgi:hypothetical protein